jgi:hypothetical protein
MLNFTAGDDVSLVVPFTVDSEYQTPDTGTVTYSVRDNTGTLITGLTNISLYVTSGITETAITVPAINNAISLPTEIRTLICSFKVGSKPYQFVQAYRLNPWLNIAMTEDDVRRQLGLSSTELPDADVDFYGAYYLLDAQINTMTQSTGMLAAALSSGTINAKYANDALVYKAAFDLMPSLPARLLQKEQLGQASYQRYSGFDFGALHDMIADLLEDALTNITGMASTYPSLLTVGTRPDIIKGTGLPWAAGIITGV